MNFSSIDSHPRTIYPMYPKRPEEPKRTRTWAGNTIRFDKGLLTAKDLLKLVCFIMTVLLKAKNSPQFDLGVDWDDTEDRFSSGFDFEICWIILEGEESFQKRMDQYHLDLKKYEEELKEYKKLRLVALKKEVEILEKESENIENTSS